jgi:hypothetical protein
LIVSLAVVNGGQKGVAWGRIFDHPTHEIVVMEDVEGQKEPKRYGVFVTTHLSQCPELLKTIAYGLAVCQELSNSPCQSDENPGTEVLTEMRRLDFARLRVADKGPPQYFHTVLVIDVGALYVETEINIMRNMRYILGLETDCRPRVNPRTESGVCLI